MSRLSRVSARASIVALAAVGATLLASVPATAHTGQLFTATRVDGAAYFATISQTDATLGLLPTAYPVDDRPDGIEIFNETGFAIGRIVDENSTTYLLRTWDHTTGAFGTTTELTATWGDLLFVQALDTTPDGRLLTLIEILVLEGEFPVEQRWLAEINGATGAVTGISDLSDVPFEYLDSIATDPTTGITWVFADSETGPAYAFTVDLADGSHTEPEALEVIQDDLGDGYILGTDFDTAGTLWFYHASLGEGGGTVLARADGAFSATAGATEVGEVVTLEGLGVSVLSLAYDPYVAPQLAATGAPVLPLALGGAALLGAGALAFAMRRRTA